jgi:hypothetical protein
VDIEIVNVNNVRSVIHVVNTDLVNILEDVWS